ncbi:hypothetical protein ACFV1F_39410 [Streptomyces sp. NPDC059590]|uniref:hypothetical protein n=1 Tax=Streptomyces sp. NPDC059590 TaxID=3346877 RepID=UPI0036B158C2
MGHDVYFKIALPEFGLEIMAGDSLQNLRVQHPRHPVGAREIQLDLQPHEILRTVESLLGQEPGQRFETLSEPHALPLPSGRIELPGYDLLPHRSVLPRVDQRPPAAYITLDDAQPM